MKRGLFLVQLPPPVHGASVMNARVVADAALRNRVEVEILRLAYTEQLADINVATPAKFVRWAKLLFALFRALTMRRPDFVYFTPVPTGRGYVRDLPFILLVKAYRVPLILHLHGRGIAERAEGRVWRGLYRLGLRQCVIVSASAEMRDRELVPLDLTNVRLHVVSNTADRVDIERFVCARKHAHAPRFLFLSSTFPFKGIFVLLESVRRLQQRGVVFELDIVGASTAEHDRRIRTFVAAHGLQQVRVMGALYGVDKYAALGRADVLVHPTLNDYSPLVVLEAMQFGLAVVSTRIGAIPEMVIEGVHGALVAANDVDELASAVERLFGSPDIVRQMGAAARCRYLQRYSPERFSAAVLDVLRAERLVADVR